MASSFLYSKHNIGTVPKDIGFSEYLALVERSPEELERRIQRRASAFVLARDVYYSRYSSYLPAWFDALGRDRIMLITFEELVASADAISRIATFFGIHLPNDVGLARENETRAFASPWLQRQVRRYASLVPSGSFRTFLRERYRSWSA
ncbi:MAG: hypothetical protein HC834_08505, partial [Rhodospirillales bacterium]|nr:hypothetical protein [Rhodospirillales bacterium]